MSSTQEFKQSPDPTKLVVITTNINGDSTTITTQTHDKYQFLANLNTEKSRNLSQITTLQTRNTEIDNLISQINALS